MWKPMKRMCQCALLMACGLTAQAPDLALVVNKANPVTTLTRAQARKLLTGAQAKWPGGEKVVLILPPPGAPERSEALRRYCGMTEQLFSADLIHANFVGEERVTPQTMPNSRAILGVVQLVPGAIGVVAQGQNMDLVKVIHVE